MNFRTALLVVVVTVGLAVILGLAVADSYFAPYPGAGRTGIVVGLTASNRMCRSHLA